MPYNKDLPFDDIPLLYPQRGQWETIAILNKLAEARAALGELKGRVPIIPNPVMLINTLVLQEAKDSSTIENIITTNDKLYKAFSSGAAPADPPAKEVLRYREALWSAFKSINNPEDFNEEMVISIFRALTERDERVRIGQVRLRGGGVTVYTPPAPGAVLTEKLNNWFEAAHTAENIDPLIKMALLHYQFEAIHPFSDGNGRTGRILNVLYLCQQGLLDEPVLYLSKFILDNKTQYYSALRRVTENQTWEEWILYMLEAVRSTAILTLEKVNAIYENYMTTIEKVKLQAPKVYSRELIEAIFNQPYCKIKTLIDLGIAARNTASKHLKKLEELGILRSEDVGKETIYINIELINILSNN